MRIILPLIILWICPLFILGQQPPLQPASPNTYALVVGIAQYGNGIPNLQFSNRDAQVFAEYLKSPAGGSVPAEHIRLLEDSAATTGAVLNELDWLIKTSQPNDLVYIYFSGHGDIENITVHKNGFLLCYNTPPSNYVLTALSVLHLNDIANTLTAEKKANVVMITDACHSGNMLSAGQNRGPFLQGLLGRETVRKEVRIISCAPDELSQEGPGWGGGRSVFSYYLVNGLKGLADKSRDGAVTLDEIKNYLSHSLLADPVLKNDNLKQTPSVTGQQQFVVARVDAATLTSAETEDSVARVMMAPLPVARKNEEEEEITDPPQDYFFRLLKNNSLERLTDSLILNEQPVPEIPFLLINKLKDGVREEIKKRDQKKLDAMADSLRSQNNPVPEKEIELFLNKKITEKFETSAKIASLNALEKMLHESPKMLNRFNSKLAVAFDDRGQQAIDLYLAGDEAELEKRRYYNSSNSNYDVYPKMFSVAIKLAPGNEYLVKMLEVKKYYFSGVAARIKIPLTVPEQQKSLLQTAMAAQKKALSLEENLACIYNEMGILKQLEKDYTAAEKNYLRASEISPGWAIPQANLAGLYALTRNFQKGFLAGTRADSLQPNLQNTMANLGALNERTGNHLVAEELYRKAIGINSRHYYPFERLGFLYNNTTQFALADSFYYEADLRKKGYHFDPSEQQIAFAMPPPLANEPYFCEVDTAVLAKDDLLGWFTWGVQEYWRQNYYNAQRVLRKVVALDKTNPLAYHYLGKIYFDQQQWEESELMFRYALQHYLEQPVFDRYLDSVVKAKRYSYNRDCFAVFFRKSYYKRIEDLAFTGTLYETWGHYDEAEAAFKKGAAWDAFNEAWYLKRSKLLEKLERYPEAEEAIKEYGRQKGTMAESKEYRNAKYLKDRTDKELNAFYRRRVEQFPQDSYWSHKLGLLLYDRAAAPTVNRYQDSIVYFPRKEKEIFIDEDIFYQLANNPELAIGDKNVTGTADTYLLASIDQETGTIKLPGTLESIDLSGCICTPRKDGITFLLKAAELINDSANLASIYYKIADMYLWAGSKKQSLPYYQKSLEWASGNANTRLQIAGLGRHLFQNRVALEQLVYLYEQKQINFPMQLLLAEFYIHAGMFEKGKKILSEAEQMHPYPLPVTDDLNGRLELLSGKWKQALPFYMKLWNENNGDSMAAYSIARLYAKMGNKNEAWKWLNTALEHGFRYSFVLRNDPFLATLRPLPKWEATLQPYTFINYQRKKQL